MKTYVAILVLAVSAFAINWHLASTPLDISIIEPGGADVRAPVGEAQLNPLNDIPQAFPQTFSRPIFAPSRRPYVEKKTEVETVAPIAELPAEEPVETMVRALEVDVLGLQSTPERKQALLRDKASGELAWFSLNENFAGWIISDISETGVRFENDGHWQEVPIYPESSAAQVLE